MSRPSASHDSCPCLSFFACLAAACLSQHTGSYKRKAANGENANAGLQAERGMADTKASCSCSSTTSELKTKATPKLQHQGQPDLDILCVPWHLTKNSRSATGDGFPRRRAPCLEQLAQSNLRRETCTEQLAQSSSRRATCREQLARSNLHRATCREPLAGTNLHGATCADQLAPTRLRRAPCLVLSRACFTNASCREKEEREKIWEKRT